MPIPRFAPRGHRPQFMPIAVATPPRSSLRADVADRLGLAADAPDSEIFAAVEAVKAAPQRPAAPAPRAARSEDDVLYDLAWGAP